jgi:hypothetical protein
MATPGEPPPLDVINKLAGKGAGGQISKLEADIRRKKEETKEAEYKASLRKHKHKNVPESGSDSDSDHESESAFSSKAGSSQASSQALDDDSNSSDDSEGVPWRNVLCTPLMTS